MPGAVAPDNILDAITDPVFKAYALFCMDNINYDRFGKENSPLWATDRDGKLSFDEAATVKCIYLNEGYGGNQISSLAGIEHFTGLETLHCEGNQLTELDASKMAEPDIYTLYCGYQKDGEGKVQTLTLTLRDDQKPSWNSIWASRSDNSDVVLAGE